MTKRERGAAGHTRARMLSPITRRILAVNLLALGILVAGLLYLGEYRRNLIEAELVALRTQAEMFAAALGEGTVATAGHLEHRLAQEIGLAIVRRMVATTGSRARIFDPGGRLIADSRRLAGSGDIVEIEELPPPSSGIFGVVRKLYDRIATWLPGDDAMPPYRESAVQRATDYGEVIKALSGDAAAMVRGSRPTGLVLSVAVPVQRYKQVLGALMLSKGSRQIDEALFEVRLDILKVFAVALGVTVLLSLYLAGTIARPLRHLARAAERVRHEHGRRHVIPDMAGRNDEIGELAATLRDMTEALWQRMDAIESFAADVAHEIKNPLTSLMSAVETAARIEDPEQQRSLMTIIQEDVQRLDRLITDISDASRLDAELSRAETEAVDLAPMLEILVDVEAAGATENPSAPAGLRLERKQEGAAVVDGVEGRLVQIFRNLIANARSFSPPGGFVTLTLERDDGWIRVHIDDNGPGIPKGKEEAIFERFYSQRPKSEKFGTHSGLGLSISRQIVEAHGGTIEARNRLDGNGAVVGARFTVSLPAP